MTRRRWIAAGALVLALALAGVLQRAGVVDLRRLGPRAAGANEEPPTAVLEFAAREVVQPQLVALPRRIEFSGPLVAPQTAMVRAKVGGTLLALAVGEGSRVRAGQMLGRIDPAEISTRASARRADIESARAALDQAERTHRSNERLAAENFISPIALQSSRATLDAARARLDAAEAALDAVEVNLRDTSLVAPIQGIVAKRHALPGEKLAPEQTVLTIVDLRTLELAGTVATHEVAALEAGMPVEVRIEGTERPIGAQLARIAPAAEPGTRSIGVTVVLDNADERLRAGQYGVVQAQRPDPTPRLTLPVAAIVSTAGQDSVWLIENGVLARRAVTLGRRDEQGGRVEVQGGVPPAARVLAARFDNLREGARAIVVAGRGGDPLASAAASAPAWR